MQRTIELRIEIGRPAAEIYAHLAHPPNLIGLQPLLVSMSPVEQIERTHPVRLRYRTTERFQYGPLAVHNQIAVATTLTTPGERIDTLVRSFPRLTLAVVYLLRPAPGGAELTEQITVTAARPLMGFVISQAERAQRQTLANLKARLEAAPPHTESARRPAAGSR